MTRSNSVSVFEALIVMLAFVGSRPSLAAVPSIETWTNQADGTHGWVGNTTAVGAVVWSGAGGNPDGHILSRGTGSGSFDIGALVDQVDSTDFTGNYAGITGASVDLDFQLGTFDAAYIRFRAGSASNGWAYPLTDDFSGGWRTYAAPIDAAWTDAQALSAGWLRDQDYNPGANPSLAWADLMSSVDTAEVRASIEGTGVVAIDNFRLVPEPSTVTGMSLAWGLIVLALRRRIVE